MAKVIQICYLILEGNLLTTNTSTIDYNCISTFEILEFYDTTIKTKSR